VRALIVDDSRAMRTILKGILKGLGFETFEAGHGKEALERLREVGATDLALVDWNMPEMNGWSSCRRCGPRRPTRRCACDDHHRDRHGSGDARRSRPAPTTT
jgi:CheY-like chemotaxis protein